ncbi:MAG: anhydro-N-acetylmuramic acid kinase [Immundisolibacter sp.]|uniref:anhydro-N-acetylmuramic acid kinase n=1 Tax=Immundisolibacter sp. TaxID=1934948 RepID=UPI003D115EC4
MRRPAVERFIGLMSGTSQDAVDGVLAEFAPDHPPRLLASHSIALPAALRRALDALQAPGGGDLDLALRLHHDIGLHFADCVIALLATAGLRGDGVRAIGSHGQTVRHKPDGPAPHSLQLGNAALIAARTGIPTVADFRSGDIAVGGQGAPLVPAFHKAVFGHRPGRAVLNLGGIANVSVLDLAGTRPWGWDLGPGNTLLDAWALRHLGQPCDADGRFAASGTVAPRLLDALLAHPFLARTAPKSTGREDFNLPWLDSVLAGHGPLPPADVQATLAEFTAACVERALAGLTVIEELLVCGGGTRNLDLMRRIAERLPGVRVASTAGAGIDPQQVEALAFAWLARQRVHEQPLDLGTVTGASRPVVLGCVYLP